MSRTQLPARARGGEVQNLLNLCYHFAYRHPANKVSVGGVCLPKCSSCRLQVGTTETPEHLASKTFRELTT